jgi:hypothetical protein
LSRAYGERGHAQAGGFGQSCLPVVMGDEGGCSQDDCGGHVQNEALGEAGDAGGVGGDRDGT